MTPDQHYAVKVTAARRQTPLCRYYYGKKWGLMPYAVILTASLLDWLGVECVMAKS